VSDVAIRVEGLGKQYRIGKRERYRTLRDTLAERASAPFRWARSLVSPSPLAFAAPSNLIWALRDVSFEVPQGAVVGVIGRNGAGKSTLLKVLSRITEPTEGRAEIHGRVGSLLEVGTGFHPELTGRENIFLNGAILGMRRAEIAQKFDEIVAFAEIDRFLDTPVKHYSSGMYMRLAFAVAAHLDPEIMVVDEVLAVGDAQFQKKCLGKMGDVARNGRTVLFVSHNLAAIEHLCPTALLLNQGRLTCTGNTRNVVAEYLNRHRETNRHFASVHRTGSGEIRLSSCKVSAKSVPGRSTIISGEDFIVRLGFHCLEKIPQPVFALTCRTQFGVPIFTVDTRDTGSRLGPLSGNGFVELEVYQPNLMSGSYMLDLSVGDELDPHRYDLLLGAAELRIEQADVHGFGRLSGGDWALVFVECQWRLSHEAPDLELASTGLSQM
jgi:lipopolysaccharide transport system ATP-binding protein